MSGVDKIKVLEGLFDKKRIEVLRVFLSEPQKEFYLREVARLANVPAATTYRVLSLLTSLKLISVKKMAKFKAYSLSESENTKFLEAFLKEQPLIMDIFVDKVKTLPGVERIILHGKPEQDKANVLIIGTGIDQGEIKRLSADIREKFNFKISSLSINDEQFMQMTSMGLYSGVKKILYKR